MSFSWRLLVPLLSVAALSSCYPVRTTWKGGQEPVVGISYYLPKVLAKVTASRANKKLADLAIAVASAGKAVDEATAAAKIAKQKADYAAAVLKAIPASAPKKVKDEAEARNARAAAEAAVAEANLGGAKTVFANAVKTLASAKSMTGDKPDSTVPVETIKVELLPPIPDMSRQFVLNLDHVGIRNDDLDVKVDEKGLLTSVGLASTDETPAIVVEIAKTIAEVTKLVGMGGLGGPSFAPGPERLRPKATARPVSEFDYQRIFDPAQPSEVAVINRELDALTSNFQVAVSLAGGLPPSDCRASSSGLVETVIIGEPPVGGIASTKPAAETKPSAEPTEVRGIAYKRLVPYDVSVVQCRIITDGVSEKTSPHIVQASQIAIPNGAPTNLLHIQAGGFVTTNYTIDFTNGSLTHTREQHPSEVLGFVQIFPAALKEIVAIPSDLIKLKVDYSSQEEALLKNEKAIQDAKDALRGLPTATPAPTVTP